MLLIDGSVPRYLAEKWVAQAEALHLPCHGIGDGAFDQCYSLKTIVLPKYLTRIESETFLCCRALESVTIPESVTYIGSRAFAFCNSLKRITLPNKDIKVEKNAFYNAACEKQVKRDYPHLFK